MMLTITAVTRLAQEGHCRRCTAANLQVAELVLAEFIKKHNLDGHFLERKNLLPGCRGGAPKGANLYSDEELLVMVDQVDTPYQLYKVFGVGATCVTRRWPWEVAKIMAREHVKRMGQEAANG